MAIRDLDHLISNLEQSAEDELSLLEDTGPEYFSTTQLLRLYGQWEIKNRLFRIFQKLLLNIAAFSPLWVGGYFLGQAVGWTYLSLLLLAGFPLSFMVFFAGLIFIKVFFKGKGHLDQVGDQIKVELRKRSGQTDRNIGL
jgi:hypothetical protein